MKLMACHCCGLIHRLPPAEGQLVLCTRCGAVILRPHGAERSLHSSAAAAVGAFILFWPAVLLPIVRIERMGYQRDASIVTGAWDLIRHDDWFVGSVILLFSVVFPLAKILLMLELCWLGLLHQRLKGRTYRLMEHIGRWSMMDVMLLSLMVMLVKLGQLMSFQFGPAVVAFVLCVTMSMLSSVFFHPHAIWHEQAA